MILTFSDCELDTDDLSLRRGGEPVPVEPQVFDLIRLLAENSERLVTRDEIIEHVWGGRIVSDSAISARIASARKAVGDDGKNQAIIRTVQRRGLQLVAVVRANRAERKAKPTQKPSVKYTKSDRGGALAYMVSGTGPAIMHTNAPMDIEAQWNAPVLATKFHDFQQLGQLILHDLGGTGLSDRSTFSTDFDARADDMRAVADAVGHEKISLIAFSGTCLEAIHFAIRYPERISKLVIVGGYAEGRDRRISSGAKDALRSMMAEGWSEVEGGMIHGFMSAYFPEGPIDGLRDITRLMQESFAPELALEERDVINHASVVSILPKVSCPTLIVHARRDAVHPIEQGRMLAAGIPSSELVVLETANHLPLSGHPSYETFLSALNSFMAA